MDAEEAFLNRDRIEMSIESQVSDQSTVSPVNQLNQFSALPPDTRIPRARLPRTSSFRIPPRSAKTGAPSDRGH